MYRVKNVSNNFGFVGMKLEPFMETRDCIVFRTIDIAMENKDTMTYQQLYNLLEEEYRVFLKKDLEVIYD